MRKASASKQRTGRTARLWKQVKSRTGEWPYIARQAAIGFGEHEGFMSAAAIAYYAFLSLFPCSILLVAIAGHLLQPAEAITQYQALLNRYLPGGTDFVQLNDSPLEGQLTLLRIIALLTLVWTG